MIIMVDTNDLITAKMFHEEFLPDLTYMGALARLTRVYRAMGLAPVLSIGRCILWSRNDVALMHDRYMRDMHG